MAVKYFKQPLFVLFATFTFVIIGSWTSVPALGQTPETFNTAGMETRLRTSFKLSRDEARRLHPLINRENENVTRILGHYLKDRYREKFLSLWDGIRLSRWEFESGLPVDLSRRQKSALRAARTEFESRILDVWLQDYLEILATMLELDRPQVSCIQIIFDNETEKRLKLIERETEKAVSMNAEWEKLTDERDNYLKGILDSEQFRYYMSLGKPDQGPVA